MWVWVSAARCSVVVVVIRGVPTCRLAGVRPSVGNDVRDVVVTEDIGHLPAATGPLDEVRVAQDAQVL